MHQVASVVDDDIGSAGDYLADIVHIFLLRAAVPGEYLEALMHESGGHVVLGGKGIGTGDVHLRPAGGQGLAEVGGLGLEMYREGYLQSL